MFFDIAVIGSGPAGQKAAIQAAKLGKSVCVIEQDHFIGGASLNSGTIPSKSLREAILTFSQFYERHSPFNPQDFKEKVANMLPDTGQLQYRLRQVWDKQRAILYAQFERNGVELIRGSASFCSPTQLDVQGHGVVSAQIIVIATGSEPRHPVAVPFDQDVILDSTQLLALQTIPRSLIVLGGGIVGTEYASFFAALGTSVSVFDKRDRILSLLDHEIGEAMAAFLARTGLIFSGGKRPEKIEKRSGMGYVTFEDGSTACAEKILCAMGRVAHTSSLALEKAGITINAQGFIPVNLSFQTEVPHIYAVGDVIGHPALASTSMEQGRYAIRAALELPQAPFPKVFPVGIYTIPEISCIGETEESLQNQGIGYVVGRASYDELARGFVSGSLEGLFKLLFAKEDGRLLGAHIVGRHATEIIHVAQTAMAFGATAAFFVKEIFNYPTFVEGYRVAALDALNQLGCAADPDKCVGIYQEKVW